MTSEPIDLEEFCSTLKSDDGWCDLLQDDLHKMSKSELEVWLRLLSEASQIPCDGPTPEWKAPDFYLQDMPDSEDLTPQITEITLRQVPTSSWTTVMRGLIDELGHDKFRRFVLRWLDAVPHSRSGYLARGSVNRELMRGLMWACREIPGNDVAAAIGMACSFFYMKKSPLATNAVTLLSQLNTENALSMLGVIRGKLKSPGQKEFLLLVQERVGARKGISPEDLEDLSIPSFGFQEVGRRTEQLAGFGVEMTIGRDQIQVCWSKPDGTLMKSVPAAVKRECPSELADLTRAKKEIQGALTYLKRRLDRSPLRKRVWGIESWRKNLFEHPVAATVVRRLIWEFEEKGKRVGGAWDGNGLTDRKGNRIEPDPDGKVTLWHPIDRSTEEITEWRERLEKLGITQPFKQAHREIYLLTEAERETSDHSLRFAAHILRQSQLRSISKGIGWDCDFIVRGIGVNELVLPEWEIIGQLMLQSAGGENPHTGLTTNYVSTDRVRFIRQGSRTSGGPLELVPLTEIPPIVFSEIMRDVDLFVSVCSVGNDPTWTPDDGGDFEAYWKFYALGDLANSAKTRKAVLERLIPRLKIADQCSFADRFLIVKGTKRTYKIHLGSGNILMEPNDQYLCIVPDSRASAPQGDLFLPFEGDNMLSIILSKALLLAEDHKIKDPTIVRQIG